MFGEKLLIIISVLVEAVRYGIPLLYGTTGEIITQKSGSLNLGVEGIMATGAIFGYLFGCLANSLFVAILCAFIFGSLCGMLYSFLTVTLKANQNVTGLALTIFGIGLSRFIGQTLKTQGKYPVMSNSLVKSVAENGIPLLRDIPYLGNLLFSYNILIYIGIAIAVIAWIYISRTKSGLRMRAVGENPGSADSVGINVNRMRYVNTTVGCGISGIGGLYMALVISNGAWNDNWINGYGWIAIALVVFASWSPAKAIGGSLLFGIMIALQSKISVLSTAFPKVLGWAISIPIEFYQVLPFVITALVLTISSIRKKKEGIQPTACGLNYYREDR